VRAQTKFQNTEKWRKDMDVNKLFANFDPVEFESARRFYPRWTGRRDKVSDVCVLACSALNTGSEVFLSMCTG
jgi:hypothetical protein